MNNVFELIVKLNLCCCHKVYDNNQKYGIFYKSSNVKSPFCLNIFHYVHLRELYSFCTPRRTKEIRDRETMTEIYCPEHDTFDFCRQRKLFYSFFLETIRFFIRLNSCYCCPYLLKFSFLLYVLYHTSEICFKYLSDYEKCKKKSMTCTWRQ